MNDRPAGKELSQPEGRILASLARDVNARGAEYTDDVVLDVRIYTNGPIAVEDSIERSPGFVSVVQGSSGDDPMKQGGGFEALVTVPIVVLVSLGCLLFFGRGRGGGCCPGPGNGGPTSFDPPDEPSDAPCRVDAMKLASARIDPLYVPWREVTPGMARPVVMGKESDKPYKPGVGE